MQMYTNTRNICILVYMYIYMATSRLFWCLTGGDPKQRLFQKMEARFPSSGPYLFGAGRGCFFLAEKCQPQP